jgi:peptide/nickel transport system substrate-binding protein
VEILRDEDQALQALQDNQLDAIGWGIAPSLAREVLANPGNYAGIRVAQASGVETYTLLLNLRKAPYDHPAFRQALAQGIDTQTIVQTVVIGYGDEATASLFPPSSPWRDPRLAPISFNPEEAMRKLDAAGVRDSDGDGLREEPDGTALQISLACTDLPVPLQVAELVAANLEAIGLSAKVVAVAQDERMPTLMQAQFDVMLHNISLSEPERAFFHFHSSWGSLNEGLVSGLNYGGYANPEFDEISAAALRELNPVGQRELAHQMQAILAADLPQIPLYSPRVMSLFRSDEFTRWKPQPGLGLLHRTTVEELRATGAG